MDTVLLGTTGARSSGFVRAPHIMERIVDGELVIYDPARQRVHALNPTAAFIWGFCDGKNNQAELVGLLCDSFPEEHLAIEIDVAETVEVFLREGLLV